MILSDAEIRRRLEEGDLDIEPLADPELQIQPASVDLRLGREFLEFERTNIPCIHPDSAEEVEDYVSETVVPEEEDFVVHPGDFVLGTTVERVDIPPDLIAHVEGRSSLGRLAVVVHASLPGDESVFLWTPSEGFGFYDIGEIVEQERPARAVAFDPRSLRVSTHRVTDHITNPQKRIYRVELDSGREVHVTRDHNLFTLDERGGVTRIPSEDAVGEHVLVPAGLPGSPTAKECLDVFDALGPGETTLYASDGSGVLDRSTVRSGSHADHGEPAAVDRTDAGGVEAAPDREGTRLPRELRLTPGLGWMLGFSITAGSTHRGQLRVTSTETASLDRFAAVLGTHDVDTTRHEGERTTTLRVCSDRWSTLVDELTGTGEERTVPETVFDWPRTVQRAVLEGMLDGEGHDRGTRDRLSTASPALADRAAYLGTHLGLLTSVYSTEQTADCPTSGDYETWVVEFGEGARGHDRIPVPGALLRTLREAAGMELSDAADAVDTSRSNVSDVESEGCGTVTRETLARFREAYAGAGVETTRLDQLLDGDVRFEEVVDVVETDRVEPTYDLEVQPGGQPIENFLAGRGGIFLSNTAGLCDPGYRGQITLELSNLGAAPVALSPGMRVSQLTFTELTSPAERPYGEDRGSKYQEQEGPQASRIGGDREFGGGQ